MSYSGDSEDEDLSAAEGIFNALGSPAPADNAWIQGVEIWAADRIEDPDNASSDVLNLGDVDLLNIKDGSLRGNLTFFGDLTQPAPDADAGGALIHITDSDVEDGTSYRAGDILGDKNLNLRNVIKFSGGGDDSSTADNDRLKVGSIVSTVGDIHFQGLLADVDVTGNAVDLTADPPSPSISVVDFGGFWTKDGNITIEAGTAGFDNSGIGNIGPLTAEEITVVAESPISIMGSMGQWTADGDITISSPVTTVGDWDGIWAGDHEDIGGRARNRSCWHHCWR